MKMLSAGVLAALTIAAANALAQPYPSRPIRILVGFAPGGAADITARVIGEKFTQSMGANVVVDNRTGATGIIATDIVAKSAADGYTLGIFALSFAINPSIRKLPYDTERDFTPVTITATVPLVLVVTNSLPAKNIKELIDLAKAKPNGLSVASSGSGSSPHLTAELFQLMTGIRMQHIAYKGSTAAHPELIAGQVQVMFDTLVATTSLIKGGRLRALGVTSKNRSAEFPDVPAIGEIVPGYESTSWGVMVAPAKTPAAIIDKLNKETVRALQLPDVKERMARLGAEVVANSPAEARKFLHDEVQKWAKTVKAAGITPDQQ
ncbi:MAG TPA: tripartite tricarboxylate transporter substrate binding protein [Burkholderiales bacterium]|jgi:tripartite-type tricarboxylate transporter receptor subunit TctC|nr:tripartite tricarboxylate transporter substrate binding protein [Burkholderiales bacterium]